MKIDTNKRWVDASPLIVVVVTIAAVALLWSFSINRYLGALHYSIAILLLVASNAAVYFSRETSRMARKAVAVFSILILLLFVFVDGTIRALLVLALLMAANLRVYFVNRRRAD